MASAEEFAERDVAESTATSRHCANHPDFPAIAVCSLCGRDICGHCHTISLTGYAVCANCPVREKLVPRAPIETADLTSAVPDYFRTAVWLIRSPRTFFGTVPLTTEWVRPALFGFLAVLAGTFFGTLWQYLFIGEFAEVIETTATELGMSRPNTVAVLFLSIPLVALFVYLVHAMLLYTSVRMAGAAPRFSQIMRIAGFAASAHLFQIVPPIMEFPIGHFLAVVWIFHIEVTAVQSYFRFSWGRSFLVVMLPYLFTAIFSG